MRGTVESFNEEVGLGLVRGTDGRAYPFHCTQLADGSRTVPEGVDVVFQVRAGHAGRWEAMVIERC